MNIFSKLFLGILLFTWCENGNLPQNNNIQALPAENKVLIPKGKGMFYFQKPELNYGRKLPVWTYMSSEYSDTSNILFVMHGNGRTAENYRNAWVDIAEENNALLVVPEFSREQFPKDQDYNMGNMFKMDKKDRILAKNPKTLWTYSLINPIFEYVKKKLKNKSEKYYIYGHSAGSQFVHRFMFFVPEAKVKKAVFANAGWYTMPDFNIMFPYGLKGTDCTPEHLKKIFNIKVVVLLGDKDTDPNHSQLRKTPEAMKQGKNRFERGHTFYNKCKQIADSLGVEFNWELKTVPGVAHSNRKMAPAAGKILFE